MSKPAGHPLITMRDALEDPRIFGNILPGQSWAAWRAGLIVSRGEKLTGRAPTPRTAHGTLDVPIQTRPPLHRLRGPARRQD